MKKYLPYFALFFVATLGFTWFMMPSEVFIKHDCDITKSECSLEQDGVKLFFSTGAKSIEGNAPVTYNIKIDGLSNPSTKLYLFGSSMVMNSEIIELEKVNENTYKATRDFPICTEQKMTWRLHLSAKDSDKLLKTNFDFEVFREK